MDIYLKPEYASSKQKASEVANKLIEINIEDITHSYTVSLRKKLIEFILDKELLKEYGFTPKDILAKLSKLKVSASIEKDSLIIVDKSADSVKKLIRLRNKIVEINLSGLPGVSRAILNQNSQGNYWIKTIGTNLSEVLKMEEIDQKNTVSNDIIEVSKVLGIEAARNLIIEEVNATLQNVGLTVDLRHIFLIADAMCLDGAVRGIGRYGLSGEADSVLARASFEVPLKHLIEAGMYHESDPFKYVANNIMSNQVIPIGTGGVELVVKENGKGNSEEDSGKDKK
jgi:DNA-directed RNA polymerase subunit A"